jgi:hypothetical protein
LSTAFGGVMGSGFDGVRGAGSGVGEGWASVTSVLVRMLGGVIG